MPGASGRAVFSSLFAAAAAIAVALFTFGVTPKFAELSWALCVVVVWSYALSASLLVWAARDWFHIHWVGNPTLAMVAGASGTALAAVALAFSLNSSVEQDKKLQEQNRVLGEQLEALKRIEAQLTKLQPAAASTPTVSK